MQPYISTGDLGEYLGTNVTGNHLAVIAIDSACNIIRTYTGYKLNYIKNDQIFLNGNGKEALELPEAPVVKITSVYILDQLVDDTTYYFTKGGLLVKIATAPWLSWPWGGWPWGQQNISVTYDHGYAFLESDVERDPNDDIPLPDRMPADLRSVALDLAKRIFEASAGVGGIGGSTSGINSEQIGSYQYSAGTTTSTSVAGSSAGAANTLWPSDKALLAAYKKVSAA